MTSRALRARLAKLEMRYAITAQAGGVLVMLPNESFDEARARALALPGKGSYLIVPLTLSEEEWEREAVKTEKALRVQLRERGGLG